MLPGDAAPCELLTRGDVCHVHAAAGSASPGPDAKSWAAAGLAGDAGLRAGCRIHSLRRLPTNPTIFMGWTMIVLSWRYTGTCGRCIAFGGRTRWMR